MMTYGLQMLDTQNGGDSIDIKNPYSGETIASIPQADVRDVETALDLAQKGLQISRCLSRHQRTDILNKAAMQINEEREELARLIVSEAGKTITQAQKEVDRCINTMQLSAEEAKRLNGEVIPFDAYAGAANRQGYTSRDPLGIILAITPFNDPLNLVAHKLGPAIAGGNAVILKPSQLAPLSALKLVEILFQAGLDQKIISVVTGDAAIGQALVSAPEIRMISFTGGMETGEAITRSAGLKKIAMDLGGNAAVIVMENSDIDTAITSCVSGAFWASGQNCISTQRIFIQDGAFEIFKESFVAQTKDLKVGDPMEESTDLGPMITQEQAERAERWVAQAVDMGAEVLTGHRREGSLYHPTVLCNVPQEARVWCDEVFAPIVILQPFNDLDEAIQLANKPDFSLHAGIFTNDLHTAFAAADRLESGGVMINDSSDFRFDAMPFGGYKRGSLGREGVRYALEEMTQTKVICFTR